MALHRIILNYGFCNKATGNDHHETLQTWLDDNYTHIRTQSWEESYPTTYTLSEYGRIPNDVNLTLYADETFALYAWTLKDSVDVTPCQTILIESWWQTSQPSDEPYSLTVILA